MAQVEKRVKSLEDTIRELAELHKLTELSVQSLSEEMKEFKDEMRKYIQEGEKFREDSRKSREEGEKFRDDMNRRWGELANKMGTIVEDLIYPNLPIVLSKEFSLDEPRSMGIRIRRTLKKQGIRGEIDAYFIYGDIAFINETKSTPSLDYLHKFDEFMKTKFEILFEEFSGMKIIPIFSSLNMSPEVVAEATKLGIFAVNIYGDILTFKNLEEVRGKYNL